MRFTNQTILAILAQAFLALAQSNSFNVPEGGYDATAGQSLTLEWTPTSSGTVSLILRSGASSNLDAGAYVAQNIPNSGSYTWTIPSDVTRGSDYAIEIVDDADSSITNFTPYFVIESTNTVASSTAGISLGASATASPTSSGSASASASSSASSASNSVSSAVSSISSSASASASSALSSLSSSAASRSASGSSSMSTSTGSASSSASAASSSASASITAATGGAAMATAFPGLMGVFALGALAL